MHRRLGCTVATEPDKIACENVAGGHAMQVMQDVLRSALAASLSRLSPLDRLAAAWPVVAGHAIAERSAVTALADGVVTITAESSAWRHQLVVLRSQLCADLARVSRVPLTDILFILPE